MQERWIRGAGVIVEAGELPQSRMCGSSLASGIQLESISDRDDKSPLYVTTPSNSSLKSGGLVCNVYVKTNINRIKETINISKLVNASLDWICCKPDSIPEYLYFVNVDFFGARFN